MYVRFENLTAPLAKTIFLFAGLFIFFTSKAQTMKTIDVLQNLKPYSEFMEELRKEELPQVQEEKGFERLEKSISSQYSFITLELNCIPRTEDSTRREFEQRRICEIRFEIVMDKIVLKQVYHEDPLRETALTTTISANKKISGIQWQTEPKDQSFYKEYLKYLMAADEIASIGMNCASGDNYRPGFYSEIKIGEEGIELKQINRMNSKSLDHKENYSMRDLEILIPFGKNTEMSANFITIGEMVIWFSDHSSKNLKSCGEAIRTKIKEVKENWEQ